MNNILNITSDCKLRKDAEQLILIKNEIENEINLENISLIIIDSHQTSISSGALLLISKYNVPLVITNDKYEPEVFCHSLYSFHRLTKNIDKQVLWKTKNISLEVIREIIKRKVTHQGELLKYVNCEEDQDTLFADFIDRLNNSQDLNSIIQVEALAARSYFKRLYGSSFIRFEKDAINAGLNYGYALLRAKIKAHIINKGLHPSLGMFHSSQFNNYNLADDIIEIYRPLVDYIVYKISQEEESFLKEDRQVMMQVILQKVKIKDSIVDFEYSVDVYITSIIKSYDEDNISFLNIPTLDIELYEY